MYSIHLGAEMFTISCTFSTSPPTGATRTRNVSNHHFDFQTCFTPKLRALISAPFRRRNFQKNLKCLKSWLGAYFVPLQRHFLNISTFNGAPGMRVSIMWTSKSPRHSHEVWAIHFQKYSELVSFWAFWLWNLLRTASACIHLNFQIGQDCSLKFWMYDIKYIYIYFFFNLSYELNAPHLPLELSSRATKHWKTRGAVFYLPFRTPWYSFGCMPVLALSVLCFSACSHHKFDF